MLATMSPLRPLLLPIFAAPAAAWADAVAVPDAGGSILQMIFGLVLVLAMLMASLWLLKRLSLPRGGASNLMRIVAGTSVGPRERVVVVEIGTTWLVLGVAPGRVSALAEVPRQDAATTTAAATETVAGKDFSSWLKQIMDRRNGPQ